MFRLSKSKMSTLFGCPLKYHLNYDIKPPIDSETEDHYLKAGIYLHETLEKIYSKIDEEKYLSLDIIDKVEYLEEKFDLAITGDELIDEITKAGLNNFIAWQTKMDRQCDGYYKPYAVEKSVQMVITQDFIDAFIIGYEKIAAVNKIKNLPDLKEPVLLNGFIDRVDCINKEYSILDYKSKISAVKAYEMSLYALMAAVDLKLPVKKISVWGYKDGSYSYKNIKPNNIIFGLYKITEFMDMRERYENKLKRFPRKKGFACRWCNWQKLCAKSYNSRGELKK